ncbi:hypothetical protein Daus18300_007956 [Diaporthe australafricana]|uniref:Uncharacterized protein n=1 Tax=Diaporthe australafricana TaxID=127596 RepID=A0ABR3WK15_9PEZI
MPVLARVCQALLRSKRTPVPKPSIIRPQVSRPDHSHKGNSFLIQYFVFHLASGAASYWAIEHCQWEELRQSLPASIIRAAEKDIEKNATKRLDEVQKSVSEVVRVGQRHLQKNVEKNARQRLENFDKVCRILHIPPFRPRK